MRLSALAVLRRDREQYLYQTQEAEGSQPAMKIRRNEDVNVHECDV
jgi:hypothetical protein